MHRRNSVAGRGKETHHFSMKGEGKEAHLFPLNGVFSRGLGLTLPLHVVSEHDDLRLDRGHAHWVNV